MANRVLISNPDKLYCVNGDEWIIDPDGTLHVYLNDDETFAAAPGHWTHVFRGGIGDLGIKGDRVEINSDDEADVPKAAEITE